MNCRTFSPNPCMPECLLMDGLKHDQSGLPSFFCLELSACVGIQDCTYGLVASLHCLPTKPNQNVPKVVLNCFQGGIAGVLCKFSKDDGWIPINKNLW